MQKWVVISWKGWKEGEMMMVNDLKDKYTISKIVDFDG